MTIKYDIIEEGKFKGTFKQPDFNPIFSSDWNDLVLSFLQRFPSYWKKAFDIYLYDESETIIHVYKNKKALLDYAKRRKIKIQ